MNVFGIHCSKDWWPACNFSWFGSSSNPPLLPASEVRLNCGRTGLVVYASPEPSPHQQCRPRFKNLQGEERQYILHSESKLDLGLAELPFIALQVEERRPSIDIAVQQEQQR